MSRLSEPRQTIKQHPSRTGLFGGSFDPIHHGHLILARDAMELLNLDRVVFLPAAISPHKLGTKPVSGEVRREMVAAALGDEPYFVLDDRELYRSGPSFTVETVEELRAERTESEFFYLVGLDNVAKLHTWHRYADLCRLVQFVVFGRGAENPSEIDGFQLLPRRMDISSTEIRERVARGLSIQYLVPEPVRLLIEQHRLYLAHDHDT